MYFNLFAGRINANSFWQNIYFFKYKHFDKKRITKLGSQERKEKQTSLHKIQETKTLKYLK
jgi:hypothetical protein